MPLTLHRPNRVLLGALALGICADYFFNGRLPGISAPLFIALSLVLLFSVSAGEGRRPNRANLWLAGLALCFGLGLMIRATPLLVFLDFVAVCGALLLLVAYYSRDAVLRALPIQIIGNSFKALFVGVIEPLPLVVQSARSIPARPSRRLMPIARGLLLALPVVGCFGGLLMSADSVFASYVWEITELPFSWTVDVMRWIGHAFFALGVAYVCAGGALAALATGPTAPVPHLTTGDQQALALPAEGDTQRLTLPRRLLGFTEALMVLLAVDVLFGSFMLIQVTYFFGGINTLDRTGMTYADYARRGFFELLIVTCLALALVGALAYVTRRIERWKQQAFNASSTVLIALMLGMLASAFQRMMLYEEAYGFTRLRLYTHSFMIWLAIVLPIFLIALYLNRARVFLLGTTATAIMYLALLNIVNTDALIVKENIARYQQSGRLDSFYLSQLSFDATPALVTSLDAVRGDKQRYLNEHLIRQYHSLEQMSQTQGWPSWHIGRAQSLSFLRQRYGATPPPLPDTIYPLGNDGSASSLYREEFRHDDAFNQIEVIGDALGTGQIPVRDPQGVVVDGLTVGEWYAIETTSGPWIADSNSSIPEQYTADVSNDNGQTWSRLTTRPYDNVNFSDAWGSLVEYVNGDY
ncbi:MAG TPA: DUF4173 domain-containing protein, partial [Herpetosiphonaceae bacterium]